MPKSALLCDRGTLQAILENVHPHLRDDPVEILRQVEGKATQRRSANGFLSHRIPFFAEICGFEPATESPGGRHVHHLDERGQVMLIEESRAPAAPHRWVYLRAAEQVTMYEIETFRDQAKIQRVSVSGSLPGDLGYDVSIDRHNNATAYVWKPTQGRVEVVQAWNLALPVPDTFTIQYDNDAVTSIFSLGKPVWKARPARKRSKGGASAEASVAARLVDLARAKRRSSKEAVLVYTVCAEIGNSEYLPPQIGVIFRRDAEALLASPGRFPDGAASLVDPTQQEDAPFPTGTSYPYIMIEAEAGEDWSWADTEMEKRLRSLVRAMNRLRKGDDPPFILVDLEDDPMRYISDLGEQDRPAIQPFLGTPNPRPRLISS